MHPGEYLKEIIGYGGQRGLAKKLGCSPSTVNRIVSGQLDVSADMALRLELVFERSAESWLKMQMLHDLEIARKARNSDKGKK